MCCKKMKSLVLTLFIALTTSQDALAEESLVKEANNIFGANLYQVLSKQPGNVLFSPASLHSVLSMTYQGAGGTTKEALAKTLSLPDPSAAADSYNTFMEELNNTSNDVKIIVANKAYLKAGHKLNKKFQETVIDKFHSELEEVDFSDGQAAVENINGWVEKKTEDRIKDLFKPDDVNVDTHLVLVNTLYFKAPWENAFERYYTSKKPFYVNKDEKVEVPMMFTIDMFKFKKDDDLKASIIEMTFKDPQYTLLAILPVDRNGIDDLEKKIASANLKNITESMRMMKMRVFFPKFKIEQSIDFEKSLTELGLGEIFDASKCDLTGVTEDGEDLFVSKIVQKVYLDVNEYGCEAAVASGLAAQSRSLSAYTFEADHPFLIAILKKSAETGDTILFAGRVSNPALQIEE